MHLREGRLDDLPDLADISSQALWNDEIVQYLAPYRDQYPLSHRDNQLYRLKKRFFAGNRLIVAVTDESDNSWLGKEVVAGFAFWSDTRNTSNPTSLPSSVFGNAFEQAMLRLEGCYRWYFGMDRSYDRVRFANFWEMLAENPFFEEITDHWELEVLAISPPFQRQGLGSLLLSWGMDQASRHSMPVVVAATFNGERLYKKHGFEECGRVTFQESNFSWAAMVWYPAPQP